MPDVADGFHPPLEEYLETIWELQEEGIPVIQARLAEHMDVSAPSVSEMIRRLKSEGWVDSEGRSITLTEKGQARAISVVRKHRLAERLLTDIIGLPWHKTHVEACRWEHVISDEVEERIVALLGNPATCPHGNPIPGAGGPERDLSALAGLEPGVRGLWMQLREGSQVRGSTPAEMWRGVGCLLVRPGHPPGGVMASRRGRRTHVP